MIAKAAKSMDAFDLVSKERVNSFGLALQRYSPDRAYGARVLSIVPRTGYVHEVVNVRALGAMVGACCGRGSFKNRLVRGRSSFNNAPHS